MQNDGKKWPDKTFSTKENYFRQKLRTFRRLFIGTKLAKQLPHNRLINFQPEDNHK
jgi:hypothetical protein